MVTEENPLLGDQPLPEAYSDSAKCALPTENAYDRFNREQKRKILTIVSLAGLIPMFVSGCFVPSIPQISKDLDATPATVGFSISLAVLATSFGAMFWSAYNSFYGRRIVYLCGMPIMTLASFAVAASTDVRSLLLWRFVQTLGCSGGYVIGAASIGDIYKVEERGAAMGSFIGATLAGLAIAPLVAGVFAQYWSWRGFQVALGFLGVILMLLLFFFFPETAHPGTRGIDKMRCRKQFVWISPFRCITFLRSPNIMMLTLANSFTLMSDYALLTPIAYTVGAKYGIKTEGLIGILFLPTGAGNFIGASIAGRLSDAAVQKAKKDRKGTWIPEDRLRVVWVGGLLLVPLSVILVGFTITYVDGTAGLVISLVCLFANGVGVDMVLTPLGAYTVDIMPSRSAEVMAAITALRSLLLAPVPALCIPAVETIGVATTNSISGILALIGYFMIWLTIRYGDQMRAYVDIGYPDFGAANDDVTG